MIDQVKGTRNLYGKDIDNYLHIKDKFLNCYASYGYKFVELPNIEHKDLFTKSIGENSEIVTKQMYEFEDKAGRSLVLRPEGTASVVRYHNEFHKDQSNKYSYFGKMYRYENPQKNRYREFHQAGAELIGTLDNYSDVQLIKSSFRFLNSLELNFKLKINTIGSVDERKEYVSVLKKYFDKNKKDLSKESVEKIESNTLRILDSNVQEDLQIIDLAPLITNYLEDETLQKYEDIKNMLNNINIPYSEDHKLVRGSQILNIGQSQGVGVAFGVDRIINQLQLDTHKEKIFLISQYEEEMYDISDELDKNHIPYEVPIRFSKENTQYKEAIKNNATLVINCSEKTIKIINSNKVVAFDINKLKELI